VASPTAVNKLARERGESEAMNAGETGRYLNRELSWLDFNRRVLAMAEDASLPLLERVRFLSIASLNLDEFFQVRVALLQARQAAHLSALSSDGRTPDQQLAEIRRRVLEQITAEEGAAKSLFGELAQEGIEILDWDALRKRERKSLSHVFHDEIFPVLTPLAVDPAHPFPYVSNLSFNLGVLVRHPQVRTVRFARIKVPPLFPRFVPLGEGSRFVPIEQVIAAHLAPLFPGMEIVDHCCFRVTRDADLALEEDEANDLMEAIESGLHHRRRMSDAARLEVQESIPERALDLLIQELQLQPEEIYSRSGPLDLGDLRELCALDRPDLLFEPWTPRTAPALARSGESGERADIFATLQQHDVLVHHPYESFATSVEAFLSQAAADPNVLTIKHTIYRTTSGPENPIGRTLMRAAEAGKQVVSLVELKARFDEETNIEWARKLEQAGVHVVYGLVGFKTHAKIVLVVRQEESGIRRYCHIGTGNYHPTTARLYEDLGLLSADEDLTADLADLFNHLTGYSQHPRYRKLLVAPEGMRKSFVELLEEETRHSDGRAIIKCNSISDPAMIEALYRASQAGVEIDLLVRGICCLRPGVPGLSETIRVRSVLGRFLEHSRVFCLGSEARKRRFYLGSADWMTRNLDARVEVVAPIEAPEHRARLDELFECLLSDDTAAWQLQASGRWTRVEPGTGFGAQHALQERALART